MLTNHCRLYKKVEFLACKTKQKINFAGFANRKYLQFSSSLMKQENFEIHLVSAMIFSYCRKMRYDQNEIEHKI